MAIFSWILISLLALARAASASNATHGKIHARVEGQGVPIVFIHGWSLDGDAEAADFEPVFNSSQLETKYRRIYIDLPGMGQSPPDGVKSLDDMYDRVVGYIEQNVLAAKDCKFLLAGTSIGGLFARALAYRFEDNLGGLLLRVPVVDIALWNVDPLKILITNQTLINSLSADDQKIVAKAIVQTKPFLQIYKDKVLNVIRPALAASAPNQDLLDAIQGNNDTYNIHHPFHTKQTPFNRPSLFLTGREDNEVGHVDTFSVLDAYPRATYIALDRASHAWPIDQRPFFHALVHDWLFRSREDLEHDR